MIGESLLVTPCRNEEASKSGHLRQSKRFEEEDKELKLEVEKSGFVEVPKLQPYKISPAMARHAFEFEFICGVAYMYQRTLDKKSPLCTVF